MKQIKIEIKIKRETPMFTRNLYINLSSNLI